MATTRVVICGILGRMGQEMRSGLDADPEIEVVGGCDPRAADDSSGQVGVTVTQTLDELLGKGQPDVVVDFTTAEAAASNAKVALGLGVPIVIGTTGLSESDLQQIDALAKEHKVGAMVAPNFALGANLLLHFAKTASKFFDAAEIIEIHHEAKIDAPSGTALHIAQGMREARGKPFAGDNVSKFVVEGARGGVTGDLHVHSLRMPGFVATHEVIFGGLGQSLTIRHDSIGRDSFVPGVQYAVKHIRQHTGLIIGLDNLLGLS
jgi:4-hydroxy-tetrahydrodipicolinate reductase